MHTYDSTLTHDLQHMANDGTGGMRIAIVHNIATVLHCTYIVSCITIVLYFHLPFCLASYNSIMASKSHTTEPNKAIHVLSLTNNYKYPLNCSTIYAVEILNTVLLASLGHIILSFWRCLPGWYML